MAATARLLALLTVVAVGPLAADAASAPPAQAARTRDDYRHFRVASIDLLGRAPTRDEIAAFERADFDMNRWIEAQLGGPAYVERLTRMTMDVLRLEPNVLFVNPSWQLYRHDVEGPDGKPVTVYYRENQRRARAEIDGEFCFSPEETGVVVRARLQDVAYVAVPPPHPGTPATAVSAPVAPRSPEAIKAKKVSQKLLDQRTVLVRPWWLYRDYKAAQPAQRFGDGWRDPDPQYRPVETLLEDAEHQPVVEVRVCREEAAVGDTGHVYASGRAKAPPKDGALPGGRLRAPPLDKPYATQHRGEEVACATRSGLDYAADCGCGVGLERCVPGDSNGGGNAFYTPNHVPFGPAMPLDDVRQSSQRWFPYWWSREAVRLIEDVFASDRDYREILTGKRTFVNGPLAQFYRSIQQGSCCGPEAAFGMTQETEPLFDPRRVPADLPPQDVSSWRLVEDRGPHAAGILTTPMFLEKYASARARGAAVYNDFLCKSFVADAQPLTPSKEPNLMVRSGCKTCHATLEPLAAYFARVEPSSFVFLPSAQLPARNGACKLDKNGKLNGNCNALYDAAFADATGALLRGAYGALDHADAAPAGAARDVVASPDFAACAVQRVTSSFLGRPTTPDDAALLARLDDVFVQSGYRMKALVRAVVTSDAYRRSNDTSSAAWRATP